MVFVICIILAAVILFYACCKISGDCAREEEREHPCTYCQRWGECNGVDEECPWRCDDGK